MALLKAEAEKLSNNMLERGVIEEIINRDALFGLLPFMQVNNKAYVYNRENGQGTVAYIDPNEAVQEGAATFSSVTAYLKILAGDVDVDKFLASTMSDTTSQVAVQLAAKAKLIRQKFAQTIAAGDEGANAKEFDGLPNLVTGGQTIAAGANGAAISLDMLDELLDAIPNGADALVMRSGTLRAWRALVRASGGTMPEHVMLTNLTGVTVPSHNGIPIIVNDYLAGDETQGSNDATCSVYAARLNLVDGLHGIYGGPNAGVQFEEIGTVQNKDATRYRMKWYHGLVLKSTKSLARLSGVTNI